MKKILMLKLVMYGIKSFYLAVEKLCVKPMPYDGGLKVFKFGIKTDSHRNVKGGENLPRLVFDLTRLIALD